MARSKKKARLEKSSPQPEEEDEAEEENGFQVEYFKAARVSDASEWEYFVKWFGYDDPDDDTWEPQENIASCQRLLASFWKEVGTDNKDYPPGYECYPSDTWIKKEKAWFLAHSDDEKKKKRIAQQKAREAEQAKKEAKRKKKEANSANVAKITMAKRAPRASSSASAEVRVKKESDKSNTATALGKRRRSKSESSSESDTPLQKTEKQRSNPKQKKKKNTTPLAPKDDTKTAPPAQDPASLFSDEKSVTVAASLFGDGKSAPAAEDPASLFDNEKTVPAAEDPAALFSLDAKANSRGQSPKEKIVSSPAPDRLSNSRTPSAPPAAETSRVSKKPTLPRLQTGPSGSIGPASTSSLPGQAFAKSATSTPTIPKSNRAAFLPKPKPSLRVKTDVSASASSGSGISTKQRLAQTAMQMTTPTEKVYEPTRPLPPQKSTSGILSGMSFKKRGPHVKASPTITTADITPRNLPVYSPQDTPASAPSSSVPASATFISPPLHVPKDVLSANVHPPISRKRKSNGEVQAQAQLPPRESRSFSMNEVPPASSSAEMLPSESHDVEMAPPMDFDPPPPVAPASANSPMIVNSPLIDEAEKFLQSVIPPKVSDEPFQPNPESPLAQHVIPSFTRRRPEKEQAIWTGKILLDDNDAERIVCTEGVLMPSPSSGQQAALAQGAMPLRVAMSYKGDGLVMKTFYGLDALDGILDAFNPVQEWGWIGSVDEEGTGKLGKVAEFLLARKLVVSLPVIVENKTAALILLYPSTIIHHRFPDTTSFPTSETALIAAMYSWVLGADDRSREITQRHYKRLDDALDRRDPKLPQGLYDIYDNPRSTFSGFKPDLKHATRMLEVSELLHDYLGSGGDRPFALWPPTDSEAFRGSSIPQLEMQMLLAFLKEYPAAIDRGIVGVEQDTSLRAIFVHVNSLNAGSGNIKDMPNLAGYRTLNDVRFFVYGSSDIVNPRFPNITEEIWHIGGILALTPSALLSDPLGVYERIQQVEEHDIWVCYTSPASIGMAVTLMYRGKEDAVKKRIACTAFEHGPRHSKSRTTVAKESDSGDGVDEPIRCTCDGFALEWLLEAIEDEFVSILGAPPIPASDPYCDGHGTVVHGDIVRDGKPRRKDEWEKFSDDLLGASTVTSTTHAAFPSSPPPMFPPPSREAQYKNPFASWFLDLFDCSARDRHETLDFCVKDFTRLCGNLPEEEWEEVIRREIMFNLSRMAVCRGFREELRRFVVVTGDKDKYLGSDSGGFEWVTAEAFRFHDEADGMEL